MRIDDLCDRFQTLRFPRRDERVHPDRELIVAARAQVEAAVTDDDFLADCIAQELTLIESNRPRRGLVPFSTMPETGIRFAFGYWAPGKIAAAHEHTAWTVTAVCRNELDVVTFDRAESYRQQQLVTKNCFHAPTGRVGFIFEPSIHAPRNMSADWSLSLHISSPRDGERPTDYREPMAALETTRKSVSVENTHPYARVIAARHRNQCILQLARIAAAMHVQSTTDLLGRCFALGSTRVRNFISRTSSIPAFNTRVGSAAIFTQSHDDLALELHREDDMIVLTALTPAGRMEEFAIDDAAEEALTFILRERTFDAHALPGNLSNDERQAIVAALEEIGLISRIQSPQSGCRVYGKGECQ